MSEKKASIVTITDSNFVIAIYLLICSIRKFDITARIYVLGVNLAPEEVQLLEQFEGVQVYSEDPSNKRNPTTRKGEALLLAAEDDSAYVTLLDGDCLVTGDISPYLTPEGCGLFARVRMPDEDQSVFSSRYRKGDDYGTIPAHILDIWREDVGERNASAILNTVGGGNLTLSKEYIEFARKWQTQILRILPDRATKGSHDPRSEAYFQLDESVLNSLLAFSYDAPPLYRVSLDVDHSAYVAHLGPGDPKPWVLWRKEKVKYFDSVVDLFDSARAQNYALPVIPWSFRRKNHALVHIVAQLFEYYWMTRRHAGRIIKALTRR